MYVEAAFGQVADHFVADQSRSADNDNPHGYSMFSQ
jgi:hypothetical protein